MSDRRSSSASSTAGRAAWPSGWSGSRSIRPPRSRHAATGFRAGDREVGTITSAVQSPALGRPIALGYVHRDFVEPGTPLIVAGAPAVVSALPFV